MKLRSNIDYHLPPDFKSRWLSDLRSGNYTQERQNLAILAHKQYDLHNNEVVHVEVPNSYCCLGVAYFGSAFSKTQMPNLINPDDDGPTYGEETEAACAEMGIPNEVQTKLIELNDNLYWDFLTIADWIEENL